MLMKIRFAKTKNEKLRHFKSLQVLLNKKNEKGHASQILKISGGFLLPTRNQTDAQVKLDDLPGTGENSKKR